MSNSFSIPSLSSSVSVLARQVPQIGLDSVHDIAFVSKSIGDCSNPVTHQSLKS